MEFAGTIKSRVIVHRVYVGRHAENELIQQIGTDGLRQVKHAGLRRARPGRFHRPVIGGGPQRRDEVLRVRILRVPEKDPDLVAEVLVDLEHVLAKFRGQAR